MLYVEMKDMEHYKLAGGREWRRRGTTNNTINDLFFLRKLHIKNLWMGRWKDNNRAIENRRLHRPSHHCVAQKSRNPIIAIVCVGVTEVFLEGLPVNAVVCFEEAEVGEESEVGIFVSTRTKERK
jgi:hypothetical protein